MQIHFGGTLRADAEEESYGEQGADDYVFKFYVLHKLQSLETVNNVNRKARLNIFDSLILHFLLALVIGSNNCRHSCKAFGQPHAIGSREREGDGETLSVQRFMKGLH